MSSPPPFLSLFPSVSTHKRLPNPPSPPPITLHTPSPPPNPPQSQHFCRRFDGAAPPPPHSRHTRPPHLPFFLSPPPFLPTGVQQSPPSPPPITLHTPSSPPNPPQSQHVCRRFDGTGLPPPHSQQTCLPHHPIFLSPLLFPPTGGSGAHPTHDPSPCTPPLSHQTLHRPSTSAGDPTVQSSLLLVPDTLVLTNSLSFSLPLRFFPHAATPPTQPTTRRRARPPCPTKSSSVPAHPPAIRWCCPPPSRFPAHLSSPPPYFSLSPSISSHTRQLNLPRPPPITVHAPSPAPNPPQPQHVRRRSDSAILPPPKSRHTCPPHLRFFPQALAQPTQLVVHPSLTPHSPPFPCAARPPSPQQQPTQLTTLCRARSLSATKPFSSPARPPAI